MGRSHNGETFYGVGDIFIRETCQFRDYLSPGIFFMGRPFSCDTGQWLVAAGSGTVSHQTDRQCLVKKKEDSYQKKDGEECSVLKGTDVITPLIAITANLLMTLRPLTARPMLLTSAVLTSTYSTLCGIMKKY